MYNFDSEEEKYFYWYLEELKENGVIDSIEYHPKPFLLFAKKVHTYQKPLKTKVKFVDITLLSEHSYQADFAFTWNMNYAGKLFMSLDTDMSLNYPFIANMSRHNMYAPYSVIDVKGTYNRNDAYRRFSIDQKWIYLAYKIYVQKIIPEHLFKHTFTPKKYMVTNITGKPRKLSFKPISFENYIK